MPSSDPYQGVYEGSLSRLLRLLNIGPNTLARSIGVSAEYLDDIKDTPLKDLSREDPIFNAKLTALIQERLAELIVLNQEVADKRRSLGRLMERERRKVK